MERGTPEQRELIRHAIEHGELERLGDIVKIVTSTGALDATRQAARAEAEQAQKCLDALPPSKWREALLEFSAQSVDRSH